MWNNFYDHEFFIKKLEIQELINCSYASIINFYEIIDSLLRITQSNTIVFTWDNLEHKNPNIIDKEIIIKEIGFWETVGDVYEKTKGEQGVANDGHRSVKMNRLFAKFLIKKLNNNFLLVW